MEAKSEAVKTKIRDSLMVNGVNLFNSLPRIIRNIKNDLPEFKKKLDAFLNKVPDQPECPGYRPEARDINGHPSNSIIDWIRIMDFNDNDDIPPMSGDDMWS